MKAKFPARRAAAAILVFYGGIRMARSTKRLLADSLKKLLEKKTLDDITVKEIVELSGVNRQTFYYNFQDIYDLLEWIFDEESHRLIEEFDPEKDWSRGFTEVFKYLEDNRRLILNACQSLNRQSVENYLKICFSSFVSPIIRKKAEGTHVTDENLEFVTQLYVLGYVGLVFEWVDNGMTEGDELFLDKFIALVNGSTEYVLSKMTD